MINPMYIYIQYIYQQGCFIYIYVYQPQMIEYIYIYINGQQIYQPHCQIDPASFKGLRRQFFFFGLNSRAQISAWSVASWPGLHGNGTYEMNWDEIPGTNNPCYMVKHMSFWHYEMRWHDVDLHMFLSFHIVRVDIHEHS